MQCNGFVFVFFKQKTAYEMRISDWSSDVCSSDLASPYACEQDRMHRVKRPLMFPGENGSHGSVLLVTEPAGRAGICAARAMLPHDPERNAIRNQRPPAYAGRRLANASGRRMFRNRQAKSNQRTEKTLGRKKEVKTGSH